MRFFTTQDILLTPKTRPWWMVTAISYFNYYQFLPVKHPMARQVLSFQEPWNLIGIPRRFLRKASLTVSVQNCKGPKLVAELHQKWTCKHYSPMFKGIRVHYLVQFSLILFLYKEMSPLILFHRRKFRGCIERACWSGSLKYVCQCVTFELHFIIARHSPVAIRISKQFESVSLCTKRHSLLHPSWDFVDKNYLLHEL